MENLMREFSIKKKIKINFNVKKFKKIWITKEKILEESNE